MRMLPAINFEYPDRQHKNRYEYCRVDYERRAGISGYFTVYKPDTIESFDAGIGEYEVLNDIVQDLARDGWKFYRMTNIAWWPVFHFVREIRPLDDYYDDEEP